MAKVRVNKEIISYIVDKVRKLYIPAIEKHEKTKPVYIPDVEKLYDAMLSHHNITREQLYTIPLDFLNKSTSIDVIIISQDNSYRENVVIYFNDFNNNRENRPVPKWGGYDSTVKIVEQQYFELLTAWEQAHKELTDTQYEAGIRIKTLLESCSTVNKALDAYPDLEKFIPAYIKSRLASTEEIVTRNNAANREKQAKEASDILSETLSADIAIAILDED